MTSKLENLIRRKIVTRKTTPADFAKPHKYQQRCIDFLLEKNNAGLFLDPGLGKTLVSLSAFSRLKKHGLVKGALVVAPIRVCKTTWPEEVKKWANFRHLKTVVLHGRDKNQMIKQDADIYLINPEGLEWLMDTALHGKRNLPFDVLIIDESSKFKNYSSARHKFLRRRIDKFSRTWILTGSPAPNSMLDIYGQFWFIDRGETFGTYAQYKERYFYKTGYMGRELEIKPNAEQTINNLVSKRVIAMNAEDYLDMPPLIENDLYVELDKKTMERYREIENDLYTELENESFEALTKSSAAQKCHQLTGGGLYNDLTELERLEGKIPKNREFSVFHNEKLETLLNYADEMNGKPLLIGYYYDHEQKRIVEALKKRYKLKHVPVMNRDTTANQSDKYIKAWNNGESRFLVGQYSAMAHGLNMQSVIAEIFLYSLTYNLDDYQQFIKRIYRQGQKGRVVLTRCLARNTADERIAKALVVKGGRQQDVFNALKNG